MERKDDRLTDMDKVMITALIVLGVMVLFAFVIFADTLIHWDDSMVYFP